MTPRRGYRGLGVYRAELGRWMPWPCIYYVGEPSGLRSPPAQIPGRILIGDGWRGRGGSMDTLARPLAPVFGPNALTCSYAKTVLIPVVQITKSVPLYQ